MEVDLTQPNPLVKLKVNIISSIEELKGAKAYVFLGNVNKEEILKAGANPLLVRFLDKDATPQEIEYNKVILENAWVADLAPVKEYSIANRRDILRGEIKKLEDRVDKPVYIKEYCNWLYKGCTVCQDSCPYKAIQVDKKSGVFIDYDKCTACGLCVASCPVSALQFPSVSQNSVFELAKVRGDKKITCYKNESGKGIKIPCLAMLSEVDIVLLRSSGKLDFECVGCELQSNLENFIKAVKDYNERLGGISFTSPFLKIESKKEELKELKTTSDTFFNRAEARKKITDELPYIQYDVTIDSEKCTLCESCVKWCPSSAIKLIRDKDKERIEFYPERCIGCNICVNVCPESYKDGTRVGGCNTSAGKVISVSKSNKYSKDVKILVKDELVRCRVCGEPVGSRKSLEIVKRAIKEKNPNATCGKGSTDEKDQNDMFDEEWLERCPKHRAEYAFQKQFMARFKPRGQK